jgi:hypothetical protein
MPHHQTIRNHATASALHAVTAADAFVPRLHS